MEENQEGNMPILIVAARQIYRYIQIYIQIYISIYIYFLGVQLLYTAVSVSAVQQSESAIRTHISPFLDFLPIQVTTEHQVMFPMLYDRFSLAIYFIHSSVYMSIPISQFIHPPSFPLGIHIFVLYVCVSISAWQLRSSIPFFQIPHICINI